MEKNVVKNILADIDLRQNLIKLKGSMTSTDTLEGPIVENDNTSVPDISRKTM